MRPSGLRGAQVYAAVVLTGTTIVALAMHALHISVGERRAAGFILAAMWMPALARFVATRTVDRGWQSPLPWRRWGRPGLAIVIVPLVTVTVIYIGAYGLATLAGVPRSDPAWARGRVAANVLVNLPILSIIGGVGALGEELGWRGYLQPRLDQLNVRYSLLWMIALETLFHLPLIVLAGTWARRIWAPQSPCSSRSELASRRFGRGRRTGGAACGWPFSFTRFTTRCRRCSCRRRLATGILCCSANREFFRSSRI